MDYLKFVGATLLSVVVVVISAKFVSVGVGTFAILGGIVGYFVRYRPAAHAAGYVVWVAALAAWIILFRMGLHEVLVQHPHKYAPNVVAIGSGLLVIAGGVILHPIAYGIGRFTIFAGRKILSARAG